MKKILNLDDSIQFLKSKDIVPILLEKIEKISEITALCFSKNMFITDNWFKVSDIFADNILFENVNNKVDFSSFSELFGFSLASLFEKEECQNVRDQAILKFIENSKFNYFDRLKEKKGKINFDSISNMAGVIREFQNDFHITVKGNAQIVLSKSTKILKNGEREDLSNSDIENIKEKIIELEKNGKRLLGIGITDFPKDIDKNDISLNNFSYCFVGFISFEIDLKSNSQSFIETLENLNIKPIIFTGDPFAVTFNIMKQIGYLNDQEESNVIEGGCPEKEESEQRKFYNEIFAKNHFAFCRQTPENMYQFVKHLIQKGEKVAFIGDGTNEVPAMMQSDIRIATFDATDIVKSTSDFIITKKIDLLSCFSEVFDYFKSK